VAVAAFLDPEKFAGVELDMVSDHRMSRKPMVLHLPLLQHRSFG
jgi:hypothetical protein